jgi:hypothetical protein
MNGAPKERLRSRYRACRGLFAHRADGYIKAAGIRHGRRDHRSPHYGRIRRARPWETGNLSVATDPPGGDVTVDGERAALRR